MSRRECKPRCERVKSQKATGDVIGRHWFFVAANALDVARVTITTLPPGLNTRTISRKQPRAHHPDEKQSSQLAFLIF